MNSNDAMKIKLVSKEDAVIKEKVLLIKLYKKILVAGINYDMEGDNLVEGSGMVSVKKPGIAAFGDMRYNDQNLSKLKKRNIYGRWWSKNWLEDSSYKEEEFLKNHLKNGYVTVEVCTLCSEISVNGENVEDKELKRKEAVVSDINKFCSDESSSNFLIICEGEEIPCHRIILCSR